MSAEIKKMQMELKRLGFDPQGIDGVMGKNTAKAVQAFMRATFGTTFGVTVEKDGTMAIHGPHVSDLPTTQSPLKTSLPWMQVAIRHMGLHEDHDRTALIQFLRSDGATIGDPSKFPWCGDFVQTCIKTSLPTEPFNGLVAANPYLARNWQSFGKPCIPSPGAVMVFWRGSKVGPYGHVAFYVGEDATSYFVLGGNQSNKVSITRLDKDRLLGAFWPLSSDQAPAGANIIHDPDIFLSTNEA